MVITKEQALRTGLKLYNTGKPCRKGHTSDRAVSSGQCIECKRLAEKSWYAALPPDKKKERNAGRYWPRKEKHNEASRQWRLANRDRKKQYNQTYYQRNRDILLKKNKEYNTGQDKEKRRQQCLAWYHSNKHKFKERRAAYAARRRGLKLSATPKWLTPEQLKEIEGYYTLAKEQSLLLGYPVHVDHIVPIKNDTVCGLHVPWNLQLLHASANISKNNRLVDIE